MTLQAEDAFGNHESTGGLTVAFALGNGVGSGTFGPVVDHGNGTYTSVLSGAAIGVNTVTATINAQPLTSTAPTINVTQGPLSPSLSTITIAPMSIAAAISTSDDHRGPALDAGGNPFTGRGAPFSC